MRWRALVPAGILLAAAWTGERDLLSRLPEQPFALRNPLQLDPDAERAGAKLYARECSACHGLRREGRGRAPSLDREIVRQAAPGELFWVLRNGSLRAGMPSFAHLPETERWQIIAFLRRSSGTGREPAHPR